MKQKLTIKNLEGEVLQFCIFEDQQLLDNFVELLNQSGWEHLKPAITENILDENGDATTITHEAEFDIKIEDVTNQLDQEKINQEAMEYLKSTDWLVIREMDQGTPCPQEIKELRIAARSSIVR